MQGFAEWVECAAKRKIYVHQSGKCWHCYNSKSLEDLLLFSTRLVCRQCDTKLRLSNTMLKYDKAMLKDDKSIQEPKPVEKRRKRKRKHKRR